MANLRRELLPEKIKNTAREAVTNIDPILFVCTTLLSIISIVTVYGAVDNFGMSKLKMQVFIFIVGLFVTVFIAYIDFRVIVDKLWPWMLAGSVVLLVVTLLFGESGQNMETANKSWLKIPGTGLMIQPSELVKFTFICTFSKHLYAVREHINRPRTLLFLLLHAGLVVGPILLSGDLGVALIYIVILAILLFCAGLHWGYFLGAAVLLVILFPFLWDSLEDYHRARIIIGFNPELDPLGKGMQPLLSRTAIAAGRLFGGGIFGGSYYEILPASHTDFIFATICEKFGFFGGLVVLAIFIVMVIRIFWIAKNAARTDMGGLICIGIGGMLVAQIALNLGMCLAMLPVIGITLPLLSCGGSSMLATFMMFGLIHNVNAHSNGMKSARETAKRGLHISQIHS